MTTETVQRPSEQAEIDLYRKLGLSMIPIAAGSKKPNAFQRKI